MYPYHIATGEDSKATTPIRPFNPALPTVRAISSI